MRAHIAAWLHAVARWCDDLADQCDVHEHEWDDRTIGVYYQMTCQTCGFTSMRTPRSHDGEPCDMVHGFRVREPGGPTGTYRRVG